MIIKIENVKENKDGGATVDFSYNSKELNPIVRKYYKRKRCTKQMVCDFILEGFKNYVEKR